MTASTEGLIDADGVAALAGIVRDDVLKMHVGRGLQPSADRRPELPMPVQRVRPSDPPHWDRDVATHWAAEWLRIGAETQAEIDAAEKAARDAHNERNRQLYDLVPTVVYGVPVFSDATLPRTANRPDCYLRVRQEPLHYDHGRLIGPRYFVEGIHGEREVVVRERVMMYGTAVVPARADVLGVLRRVAVAVGTPEIRRWKDLYAQADPTLWRETASDLQALMANHMGSLFGDIRREATAAHLGLDQRAKDGGLSNLDKKLTRARSLDETRDLDRLTRARILATMLGIDLDADLRQ